MRFCLLLIAVGGLLLAGCGSGAKMTAHHTTSPPTTIAGVGVTTNGPPPKPSTPRACARRWNAAANAKGRAAAKRRAPKAKAALIRRTLSDVAGRCLVYLLTPPKSAAVFIESAPGKFVFTADASGGFSSNADLQQDERLLLR